jgi:hypothetical protein
MSDLRLNGDDYEETFLGCDVVESCRSFGGTYCQHLLDRRLRQANSKKSGNFIKQTLCKMELYSCGKILTRSRYVGDRKNFTDLWYL